VSISLEEVRHIAALARLGLSDERAHAMAVELNGILEHMEVLEAAETAGAASTAVWSASSMPLRADDGPPIPCADSLSTFAPAMREGFFLVPRLATHEDGGS